MSIVKVNNLTKNFGNLTACDSINLEIKEGEIFGLLGPNGAGKTTLISMLATLLKPSSGTASINGIDVQKNPDEVRKNIGIVFQDPSLDQMLTADENLMLHAMFYSVPKDIAKERIEKVLKLVELTERRNSLVKTFSGGMKRRLEIARSLIHTPKVLFLDEPTIGLDPQTRNHIWGYIKNLAKKEKTTILLTTHYMEEAEFLCERVGIIDLGKIVALDTVNNLKKVLGGDVIKIKSEESVENFSKLPFVISAEEVDDSIFLTVKDSSQDMVTLLKNHSITSAEVRKPTLNDVFLHFTGKEIREEEGDPAYSMRMWAK